MVLCPYCGSLSPTMKQCTHCGGHFDLLSRQRTQNAMGPWFIRDQVQPFHPGCSYATLRRLALRGRIRPETVLRGPTTRQFWSFAHNTPGVAHLLGACHACNAPATQTQDACSACGASFLVAAERQHLGLSPTHMLPGDADANAIADAAFAPSEARADAPSPPPPGPAVQHEAPHDSAAAPRAGRRRKRASNAPWIVLAAVVVAGGLGYGAWVYGPDLIERTAASTPAAPAEPQAQPPTVPADLPAAAAGTGETGTDDRTASDAGPPPTQDRWLPEGVSLGVDGDGLTIIQDTGDAEPAGVPPGDTPAEPGATADREPEPSPAITPDPQPMPADPGAGVRPDPRADRIASASADELADLVREWTTGDDPPADLIAAAERRLEQLRLRERY